VTVIGEALATIHSGGVVVIPTDTVYGVGVSVAAPGAIETLFELKGRPTSKPIPVLGADIAALSAVVDFDERAEMIASRFWPGPLTLVLPRAPGFSTDLGGDGAEGIAVRVPAHNLALELLRASGALAVTSANPSGDTPATTIEEARAYLGAGVGAYLDGGVCDGVPSTVVSLLEGATLVREGPISLEEIDLS
jgi:L-threonylcarbamoyladenylate synthase